MTIGPAPLCMFCRYYQKDAAPLKVPPPESISGLICEAYPDGIPMAIILIRVDHRKPYSGDHGIQFAPKEGVTELPFYLNPNWPNEKNPQPVPLEPETKEKARTKAPLKILHLDLGALHEGYGRHKRK